MTLSDSGAAEPAAADDLRAQLAAAFDAPGDTGGARAGETETEAERAERARDERGRFARAAEEAGETPPKAADETQDEARQPPDASKPDRLAAPEGWPSDARLAWDRLPKAAQEALRADLDAGRLSLGSGAQGNAAPDPVRDVVQSFGDDIRSRGMAPEQAVKALFEAQRMLDQNPIQGLQAIARSYGVDLATLAGRQDANQPQGHADPVIGQLQQEIATLKGFLTQQQRAQHEAQAAEQARVIETFASEKGADGQPLRPHFNEVRVTMGRLIQAGEATDLADAYDKAVWARPDLRQRLLTQEREAQEAKRKAEASAAAEAARRRAVSVTPNPSVNAGPAPADNLRAELERAFSGG